MKKNCCMKFFFNKILVLGTLLCFVHLTTFSQTLYLIKADGSAGSFNNVDSIPGTESVLAGPNATTFDVKNEGYIWEVHW